MIHPPAFWWREGETLAARLLAPLAMLYGAVAARRMLEAGTQVAVPVVCIGDLSLGGSGKTPTALAVGDILRSAGERIVFLTRGYDGRLPGPVRIDPVAHVAADVGDEPLLLVRAAPTVVARDRVAGAHAAIAIGATVIVMDDGFQNPSLAKNLSLIVIDGWRGIGNARVFPAGPLRAPLEAQLAHAHGAVIIGEAASALQDVMEALAARGLPTFHAWLEPDPAAVAELKGTDVLAFAGIGDPDKFFATLIAAGIHVPVTRGFPDHHRFTPAQASALVADADAQRLKLVTTEKDHARLSGDNRLTALRERTRTVPVKLVIDDDAAFRRFLFAKLGRPTA